MTVVAVVVADVFVDQQQLYARVLSLRKGNISGGPDKLPLEAHMMEVEAGRVYRSVIAVEVSALFISFAAANRNCSEALQTPRRATRSNQHGTASRVSHSQTTEALRL